MIFLQSSPDYTAYFIVSIFVVVLAVIVLVLIIRSVFRIDTQVDNQHAMIYLLVKLCEKSNVTDEEIQKITKYFNVKGYSKPAKKSNR
jgi:hypothetical protein